MSIRREALVHDRLLAEIREHPGPTENDSNGDSPIAVGSTLTKRAAVRIFESALQSRLQDLEARRLKDDGKSFYTIGSSGHEANAVLGHLLRLDDPALLHYRSGAFLAARQRKADGETPIFDTMLSLTAAAEDPVAGGRHKVLGSARLMVPPQTSTIASHLPRAVGIAYSLARQERLGIEGAVPHDAIVYCSFGDASANHASAQSGFHAASAATLHRQPCPILFACEDNGLGISVRTPNDYIERLFVNRAGIDYWKADGRDLADTHDIAKTAIEHCRRTRRPTFLHLRTVRLLGHAGSDVESNYLDKSEIEANEARDPMLAFADLLLRTGAIEKDGLLAMHEDMEQRIRRAGAEAASRRKLASAAEVMNPLALPAKEDIRIPIPARQARLRAFHDRLPEDDARPRHLAFRLAQGLKDIMLAYPAAFVFGEDVARKGGVYHVTDDLNRTFGSGRVFNTILDETTILGLASGMALTGCLPIPEIQYLAYIHNALDQIRGEAASLRFFSNGQFKNPMVVRVASYGYQKGFGGHFHNDNSLGALLDIPGLIIASPARADDAVGMLRTCAATADQHGAVCLFLEPIALYMTKDLHEPDDDAWQFAYPAPGESIPLGESRAYIDGDGDDALTIISFANGLHMSLQAQRRLRNMGIPSRVLDLRWLAPLPWPAIREHANATGRVLIVDECRRTGGGPSAHIVSGLQEHRQLIVRRIAGDDTFIPLGPAADEVLLQVDDIVIAAEKLSSEVPA